MGGRKSEGQEQAYPDPIPWLLGSEEPWTRYRTLVDLAGQPEDAPRVRAARDEMIAHPQVAQLVAECATWEGDPLKRHNDAGHPIHKLSVLADLGLRAEDPGLGPVIGAVCAHQSRDGAFQTLLNISPRFGGTGEDTWTWLACDAPVLLHSLLALGLGEDPRVRRATEQLTAQVEEVGWQCVGGPEVGRFRGPGRKDDPCPIANLYALKALAQVPGMASSPAARAGAEMLLGHWAQRSERRFYLFGMGTDFRKLKYPFVWYDVLHVVEVLRHFPFVRGDPRFLELVEVVASQADAEGRYTASSMYRAWAGWSFADKKQASPWLTLLAQRAVTRARSKGDA